MILEQMLYILYPIKFWKNKDCIWALINSGSEVYVITSTYAIVLGFKICSIKINAQKIDSSFFKIFNIVIASF